MKTLNNFSLVVSTYNNNLPVLNIFEAFAKKNFDIDGNIKRILICEDSPNKSEYFNTIIPNEIGKTWSTQLYDSLINLKTEYIIYCLEDYIFYKPINLVKLNFYLNWAYKNKVNYLRLCPKPKGFVKEIGNIYKLNEYAIYKNSLFLTVWNRNYFLSLLRKFNNPWEFEVNGSKKVRFVDGYYTINEKFIYINHVVAKGCWINSNIRKLNIPLELKNSLPMMKFTDEMIWILKKNLLKIFELIPDSFIKYHFYYLFK